MTSALPTSRQDADQTYEDDLTEMVEEIGTAVATGLVPFVGQAVNIYDTVECLLALHNSKGVEAQNEAKFDLVLALVGWIPGAGGGVKKTIRIVNKNPTRYAPILFDGLRMVCLKLGIYTSPELLLEKLFDANRLSTVLATAQTSVEKSWVYEQMPSTGQQILSSTMATVRASLPAMVMLVTIKLMHWKRLQRNTSARSSGSIRKDASAIKPAAKDPTLAKQGANSPKNTSSNATGNTTVGAKLLEVTNEAMGMLGEHITDYFLYEEYGWGKDWNSHDKGVDGSWKHLPDQQFPGKLNEESKLNPLLALKAHGVGIDGVWKVQLGDPHNDRKPYAIIESKASIHRKAPSNASRKPGVAGKLSSNNRRISKAIAAKEAMLPKAGDLLEPSTTDNADGVSAQPSGRKSGNRPSNANAKRKATQKPAESLNREGAAFESNGEKVFVQMSRDWVAKNIYRAVDDPKIAFDIVQNHVYVYSRHLFYTPVYLPSAAEHLLALQAEDGTTAALHSSHKDHTIPTTHRYNEQAIRKAVNAKLVRLKLSPEP